jgi:hypothetical protein
LTGIFTPEGREVSGGWKDYLMKTVTTFNLFIPAQYYLLLLKKICLLRFLFAEFLHSTKLENELKIVDVSACGSYLREKCDTLVLPLYMY